MLWPGPSGAAGGYPHPLGGSPAAAYPGQIGDTFAVMRDAIGPLQMDPNSEVKGSLESSRQSGLDTPTAMAMEAVVEQRENR